MKTLTKKLIVSVVLSAIAMSNVLPAQAGSSKERSDLLKSYRKQSAMKLVVKKRESLRAAQELEALVKPLQLAYRKQLEKTDPSLAERIYRVRDEAAKRSLRETEVQALKDLMAQNESALKRAFDATQTNRQELARRVGQSLKGKPLRLGDWLVLGGQRQSTLQPVQPPQPTDEIFQAPYSDRETSLSNMIIASSSAEANVSTGTVKVTGLAVDAGGGSAKAGILQFFTPPSNLDKIRVSAKLRYEYNLFLLAVLGFAYGSTDIYLDVHGPRGAECSDDINTAWMIAPLIFWGTAEGEGTVTVSCDFEPSSQDEGSEYIVATGVTNFNLGTLIGGSTARTSAEVQNIKVKYED